MSGIKLVDPTTGLEYRAGDLAALSVSNKRDGTVTTTSGVFFLAANPNRKFAVGQNLSTTNRIAFEEFNGTAVIGTTYTVAPLQPFSISTQNRVNFISENGNVPVALTEG